MVRDVTAVVVETRDRLCRCRGFGPQARFYLSFPFGNENKITLTSQRGAVAMEDTGYMSTVRLEAVNTPSVAEIDMQPASYDIWDKNIA